MERVFERIDAAGVGVCSQYAVDQFVLELLQLGQLAEVAVGGVVVGKVVAVVDGEVGVEDVFESLDAGLVGDAFGVADVGDVLCIARMVSFVVASRRSFSRCRRAASTRARSSAALRSASRRCCSRAL